MGKSPQCEDLSHAQNVLDTMIVPQGGVPQGHEVI
jgi:hypothetical protein